MVRATIFVLAALLASGPAKALSLSMPLACEYGTNCFIQNYVDDAAGPEATDYHCGKRTYGGHKGTDFRLTDFTAMARGVDVLAAADGTVLRLRNDAPDTGLDAGREAIGHHECGNGVVIAHADGFETQYCHLKRGSIAVHIGEHVAAGTVLGQVGYSGMTEFPHVHLQVSQHGKILDPFNATNTACSAQPVSLWSAEAARQMPYLDTAILRAGFSDHIPARDNINTPLLPMETIAADAPMLTFWGEVMGLQPGDLLGLRITAPDGSVLAEKRTPRLA